MCTNCRILNLLTVKKPGTYFGICFVFSKTNKIDVEQLLSS